MKYETYLKQLKKSKYILKTGENLIGLKIENNEQFDLKKRIGCLRLFAMYSKESLIKDRTVIGNGKQVPKLEFINLDLKIDWLYIFSWIVEIFNDEGVVNVEGDFKQWRYKQVEIDGTYTIELRIVTNQEDSSLITVVIDKFKGEKGDKKNFSRMRIPLFADQVLILIRNLIAIMKDLPNFYFVLKHHLVKDKALKIKRKTNENFLKIGEIKNSIDDLFLNISDSTMLYTSSEHRLLYGRWLRFQGEAVNISSDGYLTTTTDEFLLEDNKGKSGALYALAFCAGLNMEGLFGN